MRHHVELTRRATLPLSASTWNPDQLLPVSGGICQILDLAGLAMSFFALAMETLPDTFNYSLAHFLALRISLINVISASACMVLWHGILTACGVYTPARTRSFGDYVFRLAVALNSCTALVALLSLLRHPERSLWPSIELFWLFSFTLLVVLRTFLLAFHRVIRPKLRRERRLLVVGSDARALELATELAQHEVWAYRLLGYVDSKEGPLAVPAEQILCDVDGLSEFLMRQVVDEVVISLGIHLHSEQIDRLIRICAQAGVPCQYFTSFPGEMAGKRRTFARNSDRVLLQFIHDDSRRYLKRSMDFVGALVGLVLLSPLLLGTALAVRLTSSGPIVFQQERYGLNKRKFMMYKFRSMVVDAEARQATIEHLNENAGPTFKIKADPRVTAVGAVIRKLSIDELPQLINVLRGDMSLVGPRPLPTRDVSRFSEAWLMRRFSVKPGLTCLWQVMGRSDVDFQRWIELDLEYIDNWCLSLDVMIIAKTIPAVLKSRGAA